MKKIILIIIFSLCLKVYSNELILQHGGEIGEISIGYGINKKEHNIDLFFGKVFEDNFNIYALKYYYNIINYKSFLISSGVMIYHTDIDNFKNYSSDYYEQSVENRLYLFYTLEQKFYNYSFYFENGINDINIEAYYNNKLHLDDLMSIGLGFKYHF